MAPPTLSFQSNTYLTAHRAASLGPPPSTLFLPQQPPGSADQPSSQAQPLAVTYVSRVGELEDEHIFAVPDVPHGSSEWEKIKGDVIIALEGVQGIKSVKVMDAPKSRVKRAGGEL